MIGSRIIGREDEEEDDKDSTDELKLLDIDELELLLERSDCWLLLMLDDEDEEREEDDEEKDEEKDEELKEELETMIAGGGRAHKDRETVSTVTVPPNASAIPNHVVFAPTVMPASSITMPRNVVLAASVVACVGVQNTLQSDAPFNEIIEPTTEVSAPFALKMNVPLPFKFSGPPIFIAPELQYTPGV